MASQIPIFTIYLLGASLLAIFTSIYMALNRRTPGYHTGAVFTLVNATWSIGYALEIASPDLGAKVFWFTVKNLALELVPILFIYFVIQFLEIGNISNKLKYSLAVQPVLSIFLMLTNDRHHLIWGTMLADPVSFYSPLHVNYHIGYWISLGYIYSLLFFSTVVTLWTLQNSRRMYWRRVTLLTLCVILPWFANMLFSLGLSSYQYDVAPLLVNLTSIILTWISPDLLYKRDVIPLARELIIEGIQDAVLVLGPNNKILDANFAAKQLFKLPLIDMPEISLEDMNPSLYQQLNFDGVSSQIKLDNSGEERFYDINFSRLKSWNTASSTSIIVLRDITEIKRYSEHLEHLVEERTRQLRNAERLATIGETAAMVGHDLRNPLQVIVGTIFFIKKQLQNLDDSEANSWQEIERMINTINSEAEYMNKIVSDLHDYAKVFNIKLGEIDLKSVIQDTISRIQMPNVKLTLKLPDDLPPIQADEIMIRRVFTNIVTNAVQAMPDGGKLRVKARVKGKMVYVDVIDSGIGIPPENMDNLFVPLFTTKSKGTGFGLCVCKRFIEGHGGQIKVKSKEGKGATFTVVLPFNPEEVVVM